MKDLSTIKELTTEFPSTWSFLGSPESANQIPNEHKDQIHFLSTEGSKIVNGFLNGSKIIKGIPERNPFNMDYFNSVESYFEADTEIKKWLFNRGIPFDKYVFVDQDRSGQSVLLTWKMVLKYCDGLFFAEDMVVFDETLTWALYYWHEDRLYFAQDVIYDREKEYQKTLEINEILNKITAANNG